MHKDIIIVGAGHYGLIAAQMLKKEKRDFLVLEQNDRVGDSWRRKFDSMTLFTPASMAALPELPMELDPDVRPNKSQMGDYLDRYVDHFELPVHTNHLVEKVTMDEGKFTLHTPVGKFTCNQLLMAHGNYHNPVQPEWLKDLKIPKLHIQKYKSPISVKGQKVLVVGNGNSAAQISGELTKYFDVTWSREGEPKFESLNYLGKNRFWWGERLKKKGVADAKSNPVYLFEDLSKRLKKVKNQPGILSAEGREVAFSNGQTQNFDFLIYSQGYEPDFDLLDIEGWEKDLAYLNQAGGKANIDNLFFLGVPYQRKRFPFQTKWQVQDVESLFELMKKGS